MSKPYYARWLPSILPPPFLDLVGRKFWGRVGQLFDSLRGRAIDAVRARLPGYAGSDSLDEIGNDRLLPRAPAELDIDYSARLINAWDTWARAGSALGLLSALELLGLPTGVNGATIVQQNGRSYQLLAGALSIGTLMPCVNRQALDGSRPSLPGWTFEGRDTFYSEFGILFPVDVPGLVAGSPLAGQFDAVVGRWRPGKMVYVGTWVIVTGRTLGWPPTGRTLGTEPALGGNVIRYLPPAGGNRIGYVP